MQFTVKLAFERLSGPDQGFGICCLYSFLEVNVSYVHFDYALYLNETKVSLNWLCYWQKSLKYLFSREFFFAFFFLMYGLTIDC